MDSILKLIVKPDEFKHFRLIYSIKDLILKHSLQNNPCRMCFLIAGGVWWGVNKPIESQLKFINRHGNNYTEHNLCSRCVRMRPGLIYKDCIARILGLIYQYERVKFKEIANLFKVAKPYDMLLLDYGFCLAEKEIPEIINNLTDLDDSDWITCYDIKYIDYFIKKGCKIDLPWLVYNFIRFGGKARLKKVIGLCNTKDALSRVANYDCYVDSDEIKYLMSIGISFENHYMPELDKMFYDTLFGKKISTMLATL